MSPRASEAAYRLQNTCGTSATSTSSTADMAFCASAGSDLACSWHLAAKAALALGLPRACWKVAYCAAVTGVGGWAACWGAQAGSDQAASARARLARRSGRVGTGITSEAGPADHARSGAPLYVRFATGQ